MSTAAVAIDKVLDRDNIYLPGSAGAGLSRLIMGAGVLLIAVTFGLALTQGDATFASVALHAYHVGFLISIGFSVAALGFVMILHQMNSGWTASIRRQFENIMSLVWVGGLLFLAGTVLQLLLSAKGVYLYSWMDAAHVQGDMLYEHKSGFLNVPFFYVRAAIYFLVWLGLSYALWSSSTRQDIDGDKWHTARARTISAPGLLLFAFTTAFAGFDWIMSLDYHWFSTMLGVYFFAGTMMSCLCLGTLVLIVLRTFGRLHVAFTEEHLHDLMKLCFAFNVFWAYISFSQYFLIWYANLPEETAWLDLRRTGPWYVLSWILPIGHFIIPFIFLLSRTMRRSRPAAALACLWLLSMHILDLYWAVRPQVTLDGVSVGFRWIDAVAVAGPVVFFLGALVRRIGSGPLMPLKDPRLPEALIHKNYV